MLQASYLLLQINSGLHYFFCFSNASTLYCNSTSKMKKEGLILIMEPERIIGLELQVLLEGNGYAVSQCNAPNLADWLSKARNVSIIIMNIDKATPDDF